MGGGLIQLIAVGIQDIYLIGNPQITYFKTVYKKHTNFAIESIEQKFLSDPIIGTPAVAFISRDADLCGPIYLEVELPTVDGIANTYVYGVGNAFVKQATIDIADSVQ